jgi:hypothetical protein
MFNSNIRKKKNYRYMQIFIKSKPAPQNFMQNAMETL